MTRKLYTIVFAFVFATNVVNSQCDVIPTPNRYVAGAGLLNIAYLSIDTNNVDSKIVEYLISNLETQWGVGCSKEGENAMFHFVNKSNPGYQLKIHSEIVLEFNEDAMAFAGVNTILQLVDKQSSGRIVVPFCTIEDSPRFEWRGLHLDVSRHFFTVEEVKRFIDLMALYKFNKFHWHLTDDQGWRIEIKKFPLLTEVGAFRDSTVIGHYGDKPRKYEHIKYGGYYTQEQIREVVSYAADRYIAVIPEIEMPGHSRAALAAYPHLSCTGDTLPVEGLWGIFDDIYCSKLETISFLQDVLLEVIELFPYEYVHIGGDEAPKTRWNNCSNCQKVMYDNGIHDAHELQSYFIQQMDAFLTSKGKKIIGWDEILEGGLSPNAAVMSWRGQEGGIEAASHQHEVVMSPTTYCYFDYYQGTGRKEPLAIGGYLPLEKVFQFNPVPVELSEENQKYVLGGQANLWTEYIPSMQHLEYMTYPRALALIQTLWCKDKGSYEDFLQHIVNSQEEYLERYRVNYSRSIHAPQVNISRIKGGISVGVSGPMENDEFKALSQIGEISDEQLFTRKDSLSVLRTKNPQKIEFKFINFKKGTETDATLETSQNLGIPIEFITPPHPKYNHNGSLNLVDGITGSLPWKGSEWLGFNVSQVQMILDLETKQKLKMFDIGFLDLNGSWIYQPNKIKIEGSKSKGVWKVLLEVDLSALSSENGRFLIPVNGKSRYLRITIDNLDVIPEGKDGAGNTPWTFIDEIKLKYK